MDLFRTVIDGPYALLLVLQILVVAGLLLTLVWLFLYRSRELGGEEITKFLDESDDDPHESASQASLPPAPTIAPVSDTPIILPSTGDGLMDLTPATTGAFNPAFKESAPALGLHQGDSADSQTAPNAQSPAPGEGIVETLPAPGMFRADSNEREISPADAEKLQKAQAESEQLRGKLEYLESKLLEYEIVQEEIANLSSLRMENEQLRQEIVQLQRGQKGGGGNSGGSAKMESHDTNVAQTGIVKDSGDEQGDPSQPRAFATITPLPRDTTIMVPESLSNEPGLGSNEAVATEYPPEPAPNNVLQLPVGDKEPSSLGKAKETAEAFQDPAVNTQLEKILSKLEQLTK